MSSATKPVRTNKAIFQADVADKKLLRKFTMQLQGVLIQPNVTAAFLDQCKLLFREADYEAVVVERSQAENRCGWPTCQQSLNAAVDASQPYVPQPRFKIDSVQQVVYDVARGEHVFCSSECALQSSLFQRGLKDLGEDGDARFQKAQEVLRTLRGQNPNSAVVVAATVAAPQVQIVDAEQEMAVRPQPLESKQKQKQKRVSFSLPADHQDKQTLEKTTKKPYTPIVGQIKEHVVPKPADLATDAEQSWDAVEGYSSKDQAKHTKQLASVLKKKSTTVNIPATDAESKLDAMYAEMELARVARREQEERKRNGGTLPVTQNPSITAHSVADVLTRHTASLLDDDEDAGDDFDASFSFKPQSVSLEKLRPTQQNGNNKSSTSSSSSSSSNSDPAAYFLSPYAQVVNTMSDWCGQASVRKYLLPATNARRRLAPFDHYANRTFNQRKTVLRELIGTSIHEMLHRLHIRHNVDNELTELTQLFDVSHAPVQGSFGEQQWMLVSLFLLKMFHNRDLEGCAIENKRNHSGNGVISKPVWTFPTVESNKRFATLLVKLNITEDHIQYAVEDLLDEM
jgi:hypothetical protein